MTALVEELVDGMEAPAHTQDQWSSGERHPTLVDICERLHAIILGRAAKAILEADADGTRPMPEEAGLWAAPSWVWLFSRVNVGRKEMRSDGSRFRLPVRVDWSSGPISFIAGGTSAMHHWTAAGLGHTGADSLSVGVSQTILDPVISVEVSGMPTSVTVPLLDRRGIIAALNALVEAGEGAKWEMLTHLEVYADRALHKAHSTLAHELGEYRGYVDELIDPTKLDAIRTRMVFGDDEHVGKVSQLIDRCVEPRTFVRCEPLRYIVDSLRRDAVEQVRRAIGDPHIGGKIRRVAREIGLTDLDTFIEEYRQRYPSDKLSKQRALTALSTSGDVMAGWWTSTPALDRELDLVEDADGGISTSRSTRSRSVISMSEIQG